MKPVKRYDGKIPKKTEFPGPEGLAGLFLMTSPELDIPRIGNLVRGIFIQIFREQFSEF